MNEEAKFERPKRAIVFCHGARQRTLSESGGQEKIERIFDFILDTSSFMKPWEAVQPYTDWLSTPSTLRFSNLSQFKEFLSTHRFSYVLFVGLERSIFLSQVLRSTSGLADNWGILFVRGDIMDLFDGRMYDVRRKKSESISSILRSAARKLSCIDFRPRHLFTNEVHGHDFSFMRRAAETVLVNHRDYYGYINANKYFEKSDVNRIIFVDQALPHVFRKGPENIKLENFYDQDLEDLYYKNVSRYLLHIQDYFECEVNVCLHPNTPRDKPPRYDRSLKISEKKTIEALVESRFVVTHTSSITGICHVIEKPVAILSVEDRLIPNIVRKHIKKKAINEDLTIHDFREGQIKFEYPRRASLKRVVDFIRPSEFSRSLMDEIEKYIEIV